LEITSYFEPVLSRKEQDYAHTAFNNLFLIFDYDRDTNSIIVKRKKRSENEEEMYMCVNLSTNDETIGDYEYEIDEEKFIGRGNLEIPQMVKNSNPFSKKIGLVTEPIVSLKRTMKIKATQKSTINLIISVGEDKQKAIENIKKYKNEENIKKAFENGKAFIPFITCGDPDLETTAAAVRAAVENGADLIELGIPFSDPTAEGSVIQGANIRALNGGVTTDKIFALVKELRSDVKVPMVFMTYANVVFSYGAERFISTCHEIGIDGLILPDLPFEEKGEFLPICHKFGVDFISLIAPTSEQRIAMIAKEAEGFLYIVSSLGVTGTRSEIKTDLAAIVDVVRQNTNIPCAIGFGISTPEQARTMASVSDGAIVGSAIVKLLEQYGKDAPKYIGEYVKSIKDAIG